MVGPKETIMHDAKCIYFFGGVCFFRDAPTTITVVNSLDLGKLMMISNQLFCSADTMIHTSTLCD